MRDDVIAVTGLGAVSAVGGDCASTLEGFRKKHRGVGPVTLFETGIEKPVFEVPRLAAADTSNEMRTFTLLKQAVMEAAKQARLPMHDAGGRVGVCLGTTVASQFNDLAFYRTYRAEARGPLHAVDRYLQSNLAEAAATYFNFTGPTVTIVNACSSGTDAIGMAMTWLRTGLCDTVIAGGADELSLIPMAGFNALGIMSDEPCAPFDKNRKGLNLGEGAGIMILERASAAAARGRDSELTCEGYGTFGDAYHLTAPREDGSGLEKAVGRALSEAGIKPGEIAFINAHGTATGTNDRVESNVLHRLFPRDCPVCSTKGYTGHTLGAAGALEAVFTALGLREGWIPATAGFQTPDDASCLCPTREITAVEGTYALSTSMAFGGNNSALVIGRI